MLSNSKTVQVWAMHEKILALQVPTSAKKKKYFENNKRSSHITDE